MSKQNKSLAVGVISFILAMAVLGLVLYGYIANIASLVAADAFSGMVVARAIGIFVAPLGIVLGYF